MSLRSSGENGSEKDVTAPETSVFVPLPKTGNPLKKAESVSSKKGSKPKPCETAGRNEGESWYFTHI